MTHMPSPGPSDLGRDLFGDSDSELSEHSDSDDEAGPHAGENTGGCFHSRKQIRAMLGGSDQPTLPNSLTLSGTVGVFLRPDQNAQCGNPGCDKLDCPALCAEDDTSVRFRAKMPKVVIVTYPEYCGRIVKFCGPGNGGALPIWVRRGERRWEYLGHYRFESESGAVPRKKMWPERKDCVVDGFGRVLVSGAKVEGHRKRQFWHAITMVFVGFDDPVERYKRLGRDQYWF
ncbi:hypothetical protein DFJ74DRAFT_652331 [Hyaloraphidium curvatum]|nr:hypothetical protein DFJ74DRAFT_652331 [Hyaloraphidium curvatum]